MNLESVINRLNKAGGEVTEAIEKGEARRIDPGLLARYRTVNMMIADLRRATAMAERGEPIEDVRKAADAMFDGLPLGGIPASEPRHVQAVIDHIAHLEEEQVDEIRDALNAWKDARP